MPDEAEEVATMAVVEESQGWDPAWISLGIVTLVGSLVAWSVHRSRPKRSRDKQVEDAIDTLLDDDHLDLLFPSASDRDQTPNRQKGAKAEHKHSCAV